MPMTRITVQAGRPADELRQIAGILHQTLVDEFAVPPDDRFQIIDERPAGQLIYHPHYLSGQRSSRYTLFHITAGKPRSRTQKQNFYRTLTQRLQQQLALPPDDVMVVVQFTAPEDWCFGNGRMFQLEDIC